MSHVTAGSCSRGHVHTGHVLTGYVCAVLSALIPHWSICHGMSVEMLDQQSTPPICHSHPVCQSLLLESKIQCCLLESAQLIIIYYNCQHNSITYYAPQQQCRRNRSGRPGNCRTNVQLIFLSIS